MKLVQNEITIVIVGSSRELCRTLLCQSMHEELFVLTSKDIVGGSWSTCREESNAAYLGNPLLHSLGQ
jgi:hypothetical protein